MRNEDLDHYLSTDEEILPSSGFKASVMGLVLREASTPLPIPFPWKRAWPGLIAGALALVVAAVAGFALSGGSVASESPDSWAPVLGSLLEAGARARIDLAALALVLTFLALAITMRFASRRDGVRAK